MVRFSSAWKNRAFQKNSLKVGARKLLRMWKGQAVGRLELSRQMAAAGGKKESVSLSLFMEVHGS